MDEKGFDITREAPMYRKNQFDNKENNTFHVSSNTGNRTTPLKQPSPFYTSDNQYHESNPPSRIYYIDSKENPESPVTREYRERPTDPPVVFLEPKVISQPVLYNVVGDGSRDPIDRTNPIDVLPSSPGLYTISNRQRRLTEDMVDDDFQPSTNNNSRYHNFRPSTNTYSVVGTAARTSRGVQASSTEPIQPTPILYTVVGDTPDTPTRPTEDRSKSPRSNRNEKPTSLPTIYSLESERSSSPSNNQTGPFARRNTPPLEIINSPNRRSNRKTNEDFSYSKEKHDRFSQTEETMVIPPINDKEHYRPLDVSRQPPSFQPTRPKPDTKQQFLDYRSEKPYRERKQNNLSSNIPNNQTERKPRAPTYNTNQPNSVPKSTSLERYPMNTRLQRRLWDNEYQNQTDNEDDNERKPNTKKKSQPFRARAPWIPVW